MATSKEKLQIIVDAQGIAKTKAQLKAMDKARQQGVWERRGKA